MEITSPVEETIAGLLDTTAPVSNVSLAGLSGLCVTDISSLEQVWEEIEPQRRRQTVSRMGELAEDNVELDFDCIFTFCLGDSDAEVRRMAIDGLAENEETSLIQPFITLLESDSSDTVRADAATALGRYALIAEHGKLRDFHKQRICQALFAVIDDEDDQLDVRGRAIEAVSPLMMSRVTGAIRKAYRSENWRMRISAVRAMGKNCDVCWLPLLLNELASDDAEMRYEAAAACGELGEEETVSALARLVADRDTDVCLAAIRALGDIGGTEAKRSLEECLKNPNEAVKDAAQQALYELSLLDDPLSTRIL